LARRLGRAAARLLLHVDLSLDSSCFTAAADRPPPLLLRLLPPPPVYGPSCRDAILLLLLALSTNRPLLTRSQSQNAVML
jgi:hypothetical protein